MIKLEKYIEATLLIIATIMSILIVVGAIGVFNWITK